MCSVSLTVHFPNLLILTFPFFPVSKAACEARLLLWSADSVYRNPLPEVPVEEVRQSLSSISLSITLCITLCITLFLFITLRFTLFLSLSLCFPSLFFLLSLIFCLVVFQLKWHQNNELFIKAAASKGTIPSLINKYKLTNESFSTQLETRRW